MYIQHILIYVYMYTLSPNLIYISQSVTQAFICECSAMLNRIYMYIYTYRNICMSVHTCKYCCTHIYCPPTHVHISCASNVHNTYTYSAYITYTYYTRKYISKTYYIYFYIGFVVCIAYSICSKYCVYCFCFKYTHHIPHTFLCAHATCGHKHAKNLTWIHSYAYTYIFDICKTYFWNPRIALNILCMYTDSKKKNLRHNRR